MRKWIVPLLAVLISLVSVFISPSAVYAGQAYPGVDTTSEVTKPLIERATNILGQKPAFWGRYFNGLGYTNYPYKYEYKSAKENSVLRDAGIRVLPVARATEDVGGSYQLGQTDGQEHAGDFVESFSNLDGQYVIFLDVEDSTGEPPLSKKYYEGWSEAIASYCPHEGVCSSNVQLLPGVYFSAGDSTTSDNLQNAINSGSQCGGLWIADSLGTVATEWSSYYASPETHVDCRVLFWQDDEVNSSFDADLSSPDYDALNYLVLP